MSDSSNPNIKSSDLLPKFFRTDSNKKFLKATIDQLIQPGTVKKINGYIGRQNAKASTEQDIFLEEVSNDRQNYQLEPSFVVEDSLGNNTFFKDYQDYINQIKIFGGNVDNHATLNEQEHYSWDPHIDWDKFVNFQNYYWMPYGPDVIKIAGTRQLNIESTYKVTLESEIDSNAFVFTPNGLVRNPSITLYRGETYKFEINSPGNPFSIKRSKSAGIQDRYETPGLDKHAVTNGTITFSVPLDAPNILFYVSETDVEVAGVFTVLSITENTLIDVESEIIGKKTFVLSDGTALSNGMRVTFLGRVLPETYSRGNYYVEGVGDSIKLINDLDLKLISFTSTSESVLFDNDPFDKLPFEDTSMFEKGVDYIVVNRASDDLNPWSRINRWIHKDVVAVSAKHNGKTVELDQTARAVRPIIEFEPNLRLFNFGTKAIKDIDLVDRFTTDVFSMIEGTLGYYVDGVKLAHGQRVLFTADTDILVRNKVFKVNFLYLDGERRIHLELDTEPSENDVALVLQGTANKGTTVWFNGSTWIKAQQKTSLNQSPLYDVVDSNGVSFSDNSIYPGSTFVGTSIFSYKVGTGTLIDVLGFPLTYKNIQNIGDIVFNFNLAIDQFQFKQTTAVTTKNINIGFLTKTSFNSSIRTSYVNGWKLNRAKFFQPAVRIFKGGNVVAAGEFVKGDTYSILKVGTTDYTNIGSLYNTVGTQFIATSKGTGTGTAIKNTFDVDMFDDNTALTDLVIQVYINGIRLERVDTTDLTNPNWKLLDTFPYKKVLLKNSISSTDIVTIKAVTAQPINNNGYYEIPNNLQNNPLNGILGDFTLGEVIDHVNSIIDNLDTFVGTFPGASNLRDLGSISQFGTRFVQHSGPVSFSLYHITSDSNNVIKAIDYAKNEYNKFKRNFITIIDNLDDSSFDIVKQVDLILQTINKDKPNDSPFYFSDMVPYGSNIKTDHTVIDYRIKNYPLIDAFDLTSLSSRAVLVYLNGVQLLYEHDYTFDSQGFVVVRANIKNDDIISICEYDNTNGCFVPPTPTKLGLWPSYDPKKFEDTALVTPRLMIQGHDGSQVLAYNDFRDELILELEKRIYNNIKVSYDTTIFDIYDIIPGYNREVGYSLANFNQVLSPSFYKWLENVDVDFTNAASTFDRLNPLTYNYNSYNLPDGSLSPGYWKGIYRWVLDTDRPNIAPWEMLGFFDKPLWWDTVYGPSPYTSDNLILWQDLTDGIVREPGKPIVRREKFIRPELIDRIPVTDEGKIQSPEYAGWVTGFIDYSEPGDFVFGDVSPVESSWRKSSYYAFSVLSAALLLRPAKTFGLLLDRSRIIRNQAGQLVYKDTGLAITPSVIKLPSKYSSKVDIKTAGIINYIVDYILSDNSKSYSTYSYDLQNIKAVLSYRVGSFTSKEKFNLLLDSKTPLTAGSVFVPQEDYKIILNSSSPIKKITYSGVIVTKLSTGFELKGYSRTQPYFKYYSWKKTGTLVNVGGISESYLQWTPLSNYTVGKVVEYNNRYYRVTINHTSTSTFEIDNFEILQTLPIIGGRNAQFRVEWDKTSVLTLPYGTTLLTEQAVVDFLLGYGEFLKDEGFEFDEFNNDLGAITNWETSAKEFLFWTTQNWSSGEDKWTDWLPNNIVYYNSIVRYNGIYWRAKKNIGASSIFNEKEYERLSSLSNLGSSVISLSPAAEKLTINTKYSVVDDIRNPFNEYEIFSASGNTIEASFINLFREDNAISYSSKVDEGIYGATFYLVQKEQVVVLNNSTIFNDTIYNPYSGYRQERIKVAGYIASEWNGSFNIPGFIFDQATINEWDSWTDYALGDIVKYKEFYYSAKTFLPGTETFDNNHWVKLDSKPTSRLLPNWNYKASQFTDFYSLDSDNFDTGQQEIAQHYIGYQKRQYLDNIIQDQVSEYKFYQGMIAEKGTQNVLSKLFDVLSSDNQESLSFNEEWAVRLKNFGASGAFENIEFILNEGLFKTNPQGFELVDTPPISDLNSNLIIKQIPSEVYLKPLGYNSNPWPVIENYTPFLRSSGYVRESEVTSILGSISEILSTSTDGYSDGDYIWCGFEGRSWDVFKFTQTNIKILNIDATDGISIYTTTVTDFKTGDIIGFSGVSSINYFYSIEVINPSLFKLVTDSTIMLTESEFSKLIVSKIISYRISLIDDLESTYDYGVKPGDLLWCDNTGNNKWATLQYNPVYIKSEISNAQPSLNYQFGKTVVSNALGTVAVVSTGAGEIVVYDKYSPGAAWIRRQTILREKISKYDVFDPDATPALVTAQVSAISSDGRWLATGTPLASKASSGYQSTWQNNNSYNAGNIVVYNSNYYQAIKLIQLHLATPITAVSGAYITQSSSSATGYLSSSVSSASTIIVILTSDVIFDTTGTIAVNADITPSTINTDAIPNVVTTISSSTLYTSSAPNVSRYWKKIQYIPGDQLAQNSTRIHEGVICLYEKDKNNIFSLVDVILSPYPSSNEKFGSSLVFGSNELIIGAEGHNSDTGQVYKMSYSLIANATAVYNYVGSTGLYIKVSNTFRISVGDIINGVGFTSGQFVTEIIDATTLKVSASPDTEPSGILTFSTYQWKFDRDNLDVVFVLEHLNLSGSKFGSSLSLTNDNSKLIVSAPYSTVGHVYVYSINNGTYSLTQTLVGSTGVMYGSSVAVSAFGDFIAISSVGYDESASLLNTGQVLVYQRIGTTYTLDVANGIGQTLTLLNPEINQEFGYKIFFMNDFETLVVYSLNGDTVTPLTFDAGLTVFDSKLTDIVTTNTDSGRVDVYDRYNKKWVFSESLYVENDDVISTGYGTSIAVANNKIIVSAPYAKDKGIISGKIYDYSKLAGSMSWAILHQEADKVDAFKIKQAFLYNRISNKLITYLDVLDPSIGKIPGVADQEIKFKTFYDPATYSTGTSTVVVDEGMAWAENQVGVLWWNLDTARFIDSNDNSSVYKSSVWNTLHPKASIDIYEWVETTLLPSEWNIEADTEEGTALGISGQTLYDDSVYSLVKKYDKISKSFSTLYYYWVKNKKTVPSVFGRARSAYDVAQLIGNPRGEGYRYLALTGTNSFSLVNVNDHSILNDTNTVLSVEYWTVDKHSTPIHSEWKIINEGERTVIPLTIENKWVDSLCGKDLQNNPVPDMNLPVKLRYGIESRPLQGLFVNRFEALKQVIEQANRTLINLQVTSQYDISNLETYDAEPSYITGTYDETINTFEELRFTAFGVFTKPILTPVIKNGKVTSITIESKGSGYGRLRPKGDSTSLWYGPKIEILGVGIGADVTSILNSSGQIIDAEINSPGEGYSSTSTTAIVRNFSVLVKSDSQSYDVWSIYSYESSTEVWSKIISQTYDVRQYWEYADWYLTGYNQFTAPDYLINTFTDLNTIEASIDDLVKIRYANNNNWILLRKYANTVSIDWTQDYEVIGIQNGTIQFSSALYQFEGTAYGYDSSLYDTGVFDNYASKELRIILDTLKNNIFIESLKGEYVKLFFTSVRYLMHEQNYVDWIFKTSFVKAQHNVGQLTQKVTYNNDNLSNFEDYVAEVKPYRTKIREYVSAYTTVDSSQLAVTDFDIPVVYEDTQLRSIQTFVNNGIIEASSHFINEYPWKFWLDNVGFSIVELKIVDGGYGYHSAPTVIFESNSGTGAVARAFITNGVVNRIILIQSGTGYLSAPKITLDGGLTSEGVAGKVIAIIGAGVVRSNLIKMKFDRITAENLITNLQQVEIFNGTKTRIQFPLQWAPDVRIGYSSVTIDNNLVLRDTYKLLITKSINLGTTEYAGSIIFDSPPAKGAVIKVTYLKDWSILNAADRILHYYRPTTGDLGQDLAQLMTGIDYGGVEVTGIGFEGGQGWDSLPFFTEKWDTVNVTLNDYIEKVGSPTHVFNLNYTPDVGTVLNVYRSRDQVTQIVGDNSTTVYNYDSFNSVTTPTITIVTENVQVSGVVAESVTPTFTSSLALDKVMYMLNTDGIVPGMRPVGNAFVSGQYVVSVDNLTTVTLNTPPDIIPASIVYFTLNKAGSDILKVVNTEGLKVGDTVEVEPFVINTIGYGTKILSIVDENTVQLDQIMFKTIEDPDSVCKFTRQLSDPYDCIINRDGTIVLFEPVNAQSTINISVRTDSVRLDELDYVGTDPDKMATIITDQPSDEEIRTGSYQVVLPPNVSVIANDTIIIRQSTSDGSFAPQESDYDTALTGGDWNYNSARGIAADEIIVDGDGFVTANTSPAPEEVVPGQVVDALAIKVFDSPSTGTATIKIDQYISNGIEVEYLISQDINSSEAVIVKVETGFTDPLSDETSTIPQIKTRGVDYSVDFVNRTIKFNSAPEEGAVISISSFGFNGKNILALNSVISSGISEYITNADWKSSLTYLVYVNGSIVNPSTVELFRYNETISFAGYVGIRFTVPPVVGALINYVIVSGTEQTFSTMKSEVFDSIPNEFSKDIDNLLQGEVLNNFTIKIDNSLYVKRGQQIIGTNIPENTFVDYSYAEGSKFVILTTAKLGEVTGTVHFKNSMYNLTNTVGDSMPLETNVIVRVDQRILEAANNSYFKISNNRLTYVIDAMKALAYTVSSSNVLVFAGGTLLKVGLDYDLNVGGISVKLKKATYSIHAGKQLVVSIRNHASYSIIPSTSELPARLILPEITEAGHKIEVISFYKHDILEIERTSLNLRVQTSSLADNVEYYNFNNILNKKIILNRKVLNDYYVWVMKNGKLLSPSIDYKLNPSRDSITLARKLKKDETLTLMTYGSNVLTTNIAYMQFKDMLNRTHFKRLSLEKQTRLAQPLRYTDMVIELEDASAFSLPNPESNKPGIIEIEGERIEYFTITGNILGQLRRGTLGTGIRNNYKAGTYVQDIGLSETLPYQDNSIVRQITSTGSKIINLDFIPTKSLTTWSFNTGFQSSIPETYGQADDIEVFIGGYDTSNTWTANTAYLVDSIVTVGSYRYRCIISHTSSLEFETDYDPKNVTSNTKWEFFIGNIRLKKVPYTVHNVNKAPASTGGDIQFDADFAVDGTNASLRLTNTLPVGTFVTVIKKQGTDWDSITDVRTGINKVANFVRAVEGIEYHSINKYEQHLGLDNTFDQINVFFDNEHTTLDQG